MNVIVNSYRILWIFHSTGFDVILLSVNVRLQMLTVTYLRVRLESP